MIPVGIDVGVRGAIVVLDNTIEVYPIPRSKDGVDLVRLSEIIQSLKGCCVCMEKIHAMYNQSAKSTFTFGWIAGVLEGMLYSNGVPFNYVRPKEWQKIVWQEKDKVFVNKKLDTKTTSINAARRIFGSDVDFRKSNRARVWDHNCVDAALIAVYCDRTFCNNGIDYENLQSKTKKG